MTREKQITSTADISAMYDFTFDVGIALTRSTDPVEVATGKLMLTIINDWEKNPRRHSAAVVAAAYTVAQRYQEGMVEEDA